MTNELSPCDFPCCEETTDCNNCRRLPAAVFVDTITVEETAYTQRLSLASELLGGNTGTSQLLSSVYCRYHSIDHCTDVVLLPPMNPLDFFVDVAKLY